MDNIFLKRRAAEIDKTGNKNLLYGIDLSNEIISQLNMYMINYELIHLGNDDNHDTNLDNYELIKISGGDQF